MTPNDRRAELERRAERVLAKTFGGIHNVAGWAKRDASDIYVRVTLDYGRDLATWDGGILTTLVILAHDECVRLSLRQAGPNRFAVMFHLREREGRIGQRHPTMEQAIATVRGTGSDELTRLRNVCQGKEEEIAHLRSHRDMLYAALARFNVAVGVVCHWCGCEPHAETCPVQGVPNALAGPHASLNEFTKTTKPAEKLTDLSHAEHLENGNCWLHMYPCPTGLCPGVCDRCHEHDELRAACPSCARCLLCGRTGEDGKPVPPEVKEAARG